MNVIFSSLLFPQYLAYLTDQLASHDPFWSQVFMCWKIPKTRCSSDINSSLGNRPYTSGAREQCQMRQWLSSLWVLKSFEESGYSLWSIGALEERAAREEMYNPTSYATLKYTCMLNWRKSKAENICDQNKGNILEPPLLRNYSEPGAVWTPLYSPTERSQMSTWGRQHCHSAS